MVKHVHQDIHKPREKLSWAKTLWRPDVQASLRPNMTRQRASLVHSHTQKRRHVTSRRREREFQTMDSTEGVIALGRRRLILQNDQTMSSDAICLERCYSVTVLQSASITDYSTTFVTVQHEQCLTTRPWQLNSDKRMKKMATALSSVTVCQCDSSTCYNQFMTEIE